MKKKKLDIIYEDKELLVINKPSGLLTIATDKEKFKTLYHEARIYVKKQNPKNKIFIVHRLDKETSGVVLFAKSEKMKNYLQNNWNNIVKKREYIAIVEGNIKEKNKVLKYYLKENKINYVYVSNEITNDLAITEFTCLDKNKSYSLLKVNIKTGKKNQIRASLSHFGFPIIGDKKYNSTKNIINRLGLHASILEIKINNKNYIWQAKIPKNLRICFEQSLNIYEGSDKIGKITKSNSQ